DFEHPDLGEDHFELFLKPGRQITLDQSSTFLDSPFTLFQITLERADFVLQRKVVKPQKVPSFTDPPVHSASGSRGPPLFS
ncbi:MAG: hypothetical protein KDC44_05030, partial [Phaeodactylibacter sp.]|nr:hypothetical protein [Phaeodactylibacter sp.]